MIERYVSGDSRGENRHVTNGQPDTAAHPLTPRAKRNRFGFRPASRQRGRMGNPAGSPAAARRGFTDFVVEITGDNLQYASAARRAEFAAFIAQEHERPVGERIVVVNGSYSVQQLPQRMARVDWCIVPSVWWEIFGLVISEAAMFGRPVICSNVGGMAERVTHEVDGLHFEVADPARLRTPCGVLHRGRSLEASGRRNNPAGVGGKPWRTATWLFIGCGRPSARPELASAPGPQRQGCKQRGADGC